MSVTAFIQFSASSIQQQIVYAQTPTCENQPISGNAVMASGSQSTNPPSNVVDNNLGTRWSNLGRGSWIQTDLGAEKTVCYVDIAWYNGNERRYTFVISVSIDGTTFSNVLSTTSSGTTSSSERYNFADVNARFVRVTVNGNTQNDYAAITEIDVYAFTPTTTPPPPPPTNQPPAANAGIDQTVNEGTTGVTLSGGSSTDSDGTITSYSWRQTAGPTVTLSSTNTATVRFDAPSVTADTTLTFELTVTDNGGASASDTVNVLVKNVDQTPPPPPSGSIYHYEPYGTFSGSNYTDVSSTASLQLTTFSVASWFRTSTNFASNAFIVNKGGSGSDTSGQNMNYGIFMSTTENIVAEFETRTGVDHIITSPNIYNDGQWHYAVATYDGSATLRLYIDGIQVASKSTAGAVPDNTGTQPVRIGANSRSVAGFFTGNADEVRVWNRALTAQEVTDQYNNGIFNTNGQVLYLPFGTSTTPPPPPPPPTTSNFNIAAVGDWGCNSNTDRTITNIQGKNPELILGLGDYSYQSTANCWLQKVDPIDEKMEITIGNHDDESSSLLNQYLRHFGLTSQYYSFNFQNIHFTVMSTELSLGVGSSQYNFVRNDLAQAASNPNIDWIVVFYHKLAYTSPTNHAAESTLRNAYHPLFDQYGVDLVLQGHNHNYQRTFPLMYNSASPSNPIRTSTSTDTYNDPAGQVYATVGTGGISLYDLSSKASFVVTQSKTYGILNIDVLNNGTTLDATFYANDGTIKDHFSITK